MIEQASLIGELLQSGSEILRVEKLLYIPLTNTTYPIVVQAEDKKFVNMIETLQKNRSFYFSYSLDLTKRLQVAVEELISTTSGAGDQTNNLFRLFPNSINYVHKFAFNHQMLKEFVEMQYAPFRVPCIYGFVSI